MLAAAAGIAAGYAIGCLPVGWLAGRASGVDLRARGSGNTGASNVIASVSPTLGAMVGLAQILQGLTAVLLARAFGAGEGAQVAAGIACVAANNWNPFLGLSGGRGVGVALGVLLGVSWAALAAVVLLALAGLALRAVPQGFAAGFVAAPFAAWLGGESTSVVAGCVALTAVLLIKRLLSNEPPDPAAQRPEVWLNRLLYDRDIREREAWIDREQGTPDAARRQSE